MRAGQPGPLSIRSSRLASNLQPYPADISVRCFTNRSSNFMADVCGLLHCLRLMTLSDTSGFGYAYLPSRNLHFLSGYNPVTPIGSG